ncbi:MAG: GNAT family N-acetyltransferase [Eudoraea sp.]|nr:GNAT family N-acetyltransferase [Eudoraea sp.]
MVLYRRASSQDAKKIATLHAESWRLNYRGILEDRYLDHEVEADRKKVWQDRFKISRSDMIVILAEKGSDLVGFGCVFLNENEQYGAYLDNLHVLKVYSGKGIGKVLLSLMASAIIRQGGRRDMYLWVLTANKGAIRLYEKLKGQRKEQLMEEELWEQAVEKVRYYWPDVESLILDKEIPDIS